MSCNWDSYVKALQSKVETEENQGLVQEYQDTHRLAGAVRKVLNCVNSNGISSPRIFKNYNDQMNWLLAGSKFSQSFPRPFQAHHVQCPTAKRMASGSLVGSHDGWEGRVTHTRLC